MKRRIIALLLTALFILSVIPTASATDAPSADTPLETQSVPEPATEAPDAAATDTPAEDNPTEPSAAAEEMSDPTLPAAESVTGQPTEASAPERADEEPVPQGDSDTAKNYPVIISVTPGTKGVTVTWSAYTGAAKYMVFIKKGGGIWQSAALVQTTSYEHRITPDNTAYSYSVRAVDASGRSIGGFDQTGYSFSFLPAPTLKSIENTVTGQKLIWNAVSGAPVYRVYGKKNGTWYKLADTTATSYTNTRVSNLNFYTYTVRCLDKACQHPLSLRDESGISATYFAAPIITGCTAAKGSLTVCWKAVKGACRYAFFVKKSGRWVKLASTDKTAYTHKGLSDGKLYEYTVRSLNKKGKYCSGYDPNAGAFRYFAPLTLKKVSAKNKKTVLTINGSSKIASYRIERKPYRGKWSVIATSKSASYTDTTAKANIPYAYAFTALALTENTRSAAPCSRSQKENSPPATTPSANTGTISTQTARSRRTASSALPSTATPTPIKTGSAVPQRKSALPPIT